MLKNSQVKILIIDDEKPIRQVLSASLQDEGFTVQTAVDGLDGLQKIKEFRPDIVLLDIWMPGDLDGIEVLQKAKAVNLDLEIIMMSGHGTIETAVRATKLGAWDFVEKPLSMDKIIILIGNILNIQKERQEKSAILSRLRKNLYMVGNCEQMVQIKQMAARIAPTNSWILLKGENGVGKRLLSENLHYLSDRAGKPYIEVNCESMPDELQLGELFGFAQDHFAEGSPAKKGKFEIANGGTVYLENIDRLNKDAQSMLLNLLQSGQYVQQGSLEKKSLDMRIIASSPIELLSLVKDDKFNEDLFYRLSVLPITIPPLRKRREDIQMLITHFSELFCRQGGYSKKQFTADAIVLMLDYQWPGNIRELRNFIERVYILTPGELVDGPDVRFAGLNMLESNDDFNWGMNFREARAQFEKDFLLKAIDDNKGNITKTAEHIGLERSYLHRKIKTYGIDI